MKKLVKMSQKIKKLNKKINVLTAKKIRIQMEFDKNFEIQYKEFTERKIKRLTNI